MLCCCFMWRSKFLGVMSASQITVRPKRCTSFTHFFRGPWALRSCGLSSLRSEQLQLQSVHLMSRSKPRPEVGWPGNPSRFRFDLPAAQAAAPDFGDDRGNSPPSKMDCSNPGDSAGDEGSPQRNVPGASTLLHVGLDLEVGAPAIGMAMPAAAAAETGSERVSDSAIER